MTTIKKSIRIEAPREKVWEVLFGEATYPQWTAPFSPGSRAETDWQEGSKALFTDGSGSGLIGIITKSTPPSYLEISYSGLLGKGEEDYTSEEAQKMIGGTESYDLREMENGTELFVQLVLPEEYVPMMEGPWDKALVLIKELSEAA